MFKRLSNFKHPQLRLGLGFGLGLGLGLALGLALALGLGLWLLNCDIENNTLQPHYDTVVYSTNSVYNTVKAWKSHCLYFPVYKTLIIALILL